jgi:hypothetical protein
VPKATSILFNHAQHWGEAGGTGVNLSLPDPVIITNVTLLDAGGAELTQHPRLGARVVSAAAM